MNAPKGSQVRSTSKKSGIIIKSLSGKDCNVDLKRGSCADHPGICKNGGECVDISGGGFECRCGSLGASRKNEFTSLCELRSRFTTIEIYLKMRR